LLAAWSIDQLAATQRAVAIRDVLDHAREVSRALDDELAGAEAALRMLAASPSLASGDIAGFRRQASGARIPEGSALSLICAAGLTPSTPVIDGPPATDKSVVEQPVIAAMPGARPPRDAEDDGRSRRGFAVDVPVTMVTGGDACRLAFSYEAAALQRWIAQRRLPDQWMITVLDGGFVPLAQRPTARTSDAAVARAVLRDAILQHGEGHLLSRDTAGTAHYDVYTRSGRTGWFVDIAVPAAAIESSARPPLPWSVAVIVALAGFAGCMMFAFAHRFRRSTASLSAAASAMGREVNLPQHISSVSELDGLRTVIEKAHADLERERHLRAGADVDQLSALQTEREARESAELDNRAKDHFIAMLGHELRNPLNAISGASVILSSSPAANDAQAKASEVVARQVRHLGRIVDDLLDLGRLMTGKVPLELKAVDLADTCRRTVTNLQSAGRLGVDNLTVHTEPACVQADRTRLEQAISILIASVMKPGSHDGNKVELRVTRDQRQANLYVRSIGQGIPARLSAGETDSAIGSEPSLDPTEGGPSIGLGIVDRIVQMHGGRMEMQFTRRGRGGEFIVRLPLSEKRSAQTSDDARTTSARPDLRVLVVDDHDDSRAMLRLALQQSGYEAIEAMDGIEGVQLALTSRPDAAIVDIGLPGIDGYEVARRLRKLPDGANIALIALTGYGQIEDRERALRAGFDEHLAKPLDTERLEAALSLTVRPDQGQHSSNEPPSR